MEKNVFKYYNKFMLKIIEGNISCKAVLEEQKRRCEILYVDKKKRTKDFAYIISLAKRQGVKVQTCTREVIDEIATGKTHGGMILKADKREDSFLQEKIYDLALFSGFSRFNPVLRFVFLPIDRTNEALL